ncbi:UNVERIFIED_CONTAM: Pentatricopeptide repeat-containing protein [Sesamum angustifolium]|uniref:Pentatricopeptide repeat-containing protein n=1 Tax=Sesamum angustifolium TaxID=2727405 RepID=A0AAW2RLT0_9LAMI
MFSSRIYSVSAFLKKLAPQSCHFAGTTRKLNKVSLYMQRAKFIDSIRLCLRSNVAESSLVNILSSPSLDSFVVSNALRSAPSPGSALYLVETLKKVKEFSHSQDTLHALAKILAKSGQIGKLEALIDAINTGKFVNVAYISFMDRMRWYADAGDLNSVTGVWDEWRRTLDKHPCTESYNIVMKLCIEKGKDAEAVKVFCRMIEEGALPNCRTYTVIIQHLLKIGKLDSAVEVFQMLPLMRIRRTLKQYSMLVEAFTGADSPEDDVDDEDEGAGSHLEGNKDDVQLKPWLDPAALASTLKHWEPEEVSALEDANFLWTSRLVCKLIRCFKSPETAWQFFCWVAHQPGFVHDIYTISRMITKLARHGCVQLVDQLLCKVRHEGMILSFSTIRLIIDFYGFSRKGDAALSIFHNVKTICGPLSKSSLLILYSSLLRTLAKCQMNTEASDILEEMILLGICPDLQTFSGLMHHYALQGDIKTVQRLFGMVRQSGLEPDAYMYKILICAYCKCERASLALRIFEDMRNSRLMPDAATKQLLVKSLWKEGKLREAAQVEEISEETCDNIPLALPGHLYTVSTADLIRVYKMYSCTEFTWSAGSPLSCETYVTYRARQPYSDLGSISDLFGISRMDIASASSLASENLSLFLDQLLLIPIKCTSNGTHYYSHITYGIKKDDSFYSVSIKLFQNLTNYYVVEEMNPMLNPNNLTIGWRWSFLCSPGDQILPVSTMFNASASDIVMENNNRNFSAATCLPVLIPVKSPILSQLFPSSAAHRKSKHHWVLIAISSAIIALLIVFSGLVACFHILYKKKKTSARNVFSLETSDLIRAHKVPKGEPFEPKTIQDKVLPGVSGYLGKPIVYDLNVIMKATMNLSERYRIGGSVYKAMINDQVLAVKKTRDATEELQILQRVSHANLVKLMGVSSDDYGNFYIVYEYVENQSLDKWLCPKSFSFFSQS